MEIHFIAHTEHICLVSPSTARSRAMRFQMIVTNFFVMNGVEQMEFQIQPKAGIFGVNDTIYGFGLSWPYCWLSDFQCRTEHHYLSARDGRTLEEIFAHFLVQNHERLS